MEREKGKVVMMEQHREAELHDFISHLPDEILTSILSLLSLDEAVRTSILSKRWVTLWRLASSLDFDVKHMIYPFSGLNMPPKARLDFILGIPNEKGIYRYTILFFLVLNQHLGELTSCRFHHFPHDNTMKWLLFLFERKRGIKHLTLECEPNDTLLKQMFCTSFKEWGIFSYPVESLEFIRYSLYGPTPIASVDANKKLKTLKLNEVHVGDDLLDAILKCLVSLENFTLIQSCGFIKMNVQNSSLKFLEIKNLCLGSLEILAPSLEIIVFQSLYCYAKRTSIRAPCLREFHCNNSLHLNPILKSYELLEYNGGLIGSEDYNFLQNLSSITLDLDLNIIRETVGLSYILRMNNHLETLKIILPAANNTSSDDVPLPPHYSTFWEGSCVSRKLMFVYVEGFTGKLMEVGFVKYLIETSTKIKVITITCGISTEDAIGLLSTKSTSANLTIRLIDSQTRHVTLMGSPN